MIKIKVKKRTPLKLKKRLRNKARLRKKVFGTAQRPRLVVFRSQKHIYAQMVDDITGKVLVCADTLQLSKEDKSSSKDKSKKEVAEWVGQRVAQRSLEKKIQKAVFDRNGFIYHGRVRSLAESARKAGLKF